MADSGTYSPETIARRQKIADTLMMQAVKPREIRHWSQGLGQLGESALAGYEGYRADQDEKTARKEAIAQALEAFGGQGGQQPAAAAAAAPSPAAAADMPTGQPPPSPVQSSSMPAPAPTSNFMPNVGGLQVLEPSPFRKFSIADVAGAVSGERPDMPASWTDAQRARAKGVNPILLSTAARAEAGGGVPFSPGVEGGIRDQATQDRLVASGASKTRNSNHLTGNAIDLWPNGNPNAPASQYAQVADALKGAAASSGVPMNWGGDWKGGWDKPHFELGKGAPTQVASLDPSAGAGPPPGGVPGVAAALQGGAGGPPQGAPVPAPTQVAQNAPVPTAGPQGANREAIIRAMMNPWTPPAVGSLLAQQGFAKPELKEAGTDPITGQKSYQEYDPVTHTMRPVGGAPGTAQAQSQPGMLAQGVSQIDHTLTGDPYLKQFGPEIQSAVKAYINGDVMPSGNPRLQGIANAAKTIAQKYGQDMGIPVSDAVYGAKRKMQTDLASSGPTSIGGILSNGKSAFGHLAEASDKLLDVGNRNGPDVPGGGHLAAIANYTGNVALPSSETQGKIVAAKNNLLRYGQESTKFYAGTGGGEGERMAALKNHNPATASGNENAAFLENEKQLMLERLHQKELQIADVMGPKYLEDHPVRTKDLQEKLARIDANIEKLRAGPSTATPSKTTATPPPNGVDPKVWGAMTPEERALWK